MPEMTERRAESAFSRTFRRNIPMAKPPPQAACYRGQSCWPSFRRLPRRAILVLPKR